MADIGAEHVARYRREGAIVVEGLLDDATRRRMKEVLADLVERSRDVRQAADGDVAQARLELNQEARRYA